MNRFSFYNPPLIVEQHTRYRWGGEGGGLKEKTIKEEINADYELLLVLTLLLLFILD